MALEATLAIFPQTSNDHKKFYGKKYDPSKKYPEYSGTIKVPADKESIEALVKYLQNATPDYDDYEKIEFVPIRVSGWMNTSKGNSNLRFLGMKVTTDYKKQQEVNEGNSISANSSSGKSSSDSSSDGNFAGF